MTESFIAPGILLEGGLMAIIADFRYQRTALGLQTAYEIATESPWLGYLPTRKHGAFHLAMNDTGHDLGLYLQIYEWQGAYPEAKVIHVRNCRMRLDIDYCASAFQSAADMHGANVTIIDDFVPTIASIRSLKRVEAALRSLRRMAVDAGRAYIVLHGLSPGRIPIYRDHRFRVRVTELLTAYADTTCTLAGSKGRWELLMSNPMGSAFNWKGRPLPLEFDCKGDTSRFRFAPR